MKGFSKAVIGIGTISSTTAAWLATVTNPAQVRVHPNYNPLTLTNDIAVIIVPTMPINGGNSLYHDSKDLSTNNSNFFKGTISAIALPTLSDDRLDLTSKTVNLCGFGRTSTNGATSSVMLYTSQPLISNAAVSINLIIRSYWLAAGLRS